MAVALPRTRPNSIAMHLLSSGAALAHAEQDCPSPSRKSRPIRANSPRLVQHVIALEMISHRASMIRQNAHESSHAKFRKRAVRALSYRQDAVFLVHAAHNEIAICSARDIAYQAIALIHRLS